MHFCFIFFVLPFFQVKEIYPFFTWNLFSHAKKEDARLNVNVYVGNDKKYVDRLISFVEPKEERKKIKYAVTLWRGEKDPRLLTEYYAKYIAPKIKEKPVFFEVESYWCDVLDYMKSGKCLSREVLGEIRVD